jgi:hypothetical protein
VITLQFANQDKDGPHGIEVTLAPPPYNRMAMMDGPAIHGAFVSSLPAARNDTDPVAQTVFQIRQPGRYYYLCQYPGHAADGMYGKLIADSRPDTKNHNTP